MATKKLPEWLRKAAEAKATAGWTDEKYAEKGIGSVRLRLPFTTIEQLAELALQAGTSRQDVVQKLIETEHSKTKEK